MTEVEQEWKHEPLCNTPCNMNTLGIIYPLPKSVLALERVSISPEKKIQSFRLY